MLTLDKPAVSKARDPIPAAPAKPEAPRGRAPLTTHERRTIASLIQPRAKSLRAAAPAIDPEVLHWMPVAVPMLAVLILASILAIWSIL